MVLVLCRVYFKPRGDNVVEKTKAGPRRPRLAYAALKIAETFLRVYLLFNNHSIKIVFKSFDLQNDLP